jgi:hypothetical protein
MRRLVEKSITGKDIVFLEPETDADFAELERLRAADMLDERHSFGDDPEARARVAAQAEAAPKP